MIIDPQQISDKNEREFFMSFVFYLDIQDMHQDTIEYVKNTWRARKRNAASRITHDNAKTPPGPGNALPAQTSANPGMIIEFNKTVFYTWRYCHGNVANVHNGYEFVCLVCNPEARPK